MPWTELNSSYTVGIDYNAEAKTLTVMFNDGAEWDYQGVDQHEAAGMQSAVSPGRFFAAHIKPFKQAARRR